MPENLPGCAAAQHLYTISSEKIGFQQQINACALAGGTLFVAASGGPQGLLAAYHPQTGQQLWQHTVEHAGVLCIHGNHLFLIGHTSCFALNIATGKHNTLPIALPKAVETACKQQQAPASPRLFGGKKRLIPFLHTAFARQNKLYLVYQLAPQAGIQTHPVTGQAQVHTAQNYICTYYLPTLSPGDVYQVQKDKKDDAALYTFAANETDMFYSFWQSDTLVAHNLQNDKKSNVPLPAPCQGFYANGTTLYTLHEVPHKTLTLYQPANLEPLGSYVIPQQLTQRAAALGLAPSLLRELDWRWNIPASFSPDEASSLLGFTLGTAGAAIWHTQARQPLSYLPGGSPTTKKIALSYPYAALYQAGQIDVWQLP